MALLWRNKRSYDAVSWSRVSADISQHYYGLSLFIDMLYFNLLIWFFKLLTLLNFSLILHGCLSGQMAKHS